MRQKYQDGSEAATWQHTDASGASYRETNGSGSIVSNKSAEEAHARLLFII
ncbi:MAG TPA: hypothetical protein VJS44_19565 [Pyrinomonadaceae bacterium]|nr:hypothetical protein [Pyrinomonadaceae bacterium]